MKVKVLEIWVFFKPTLDYFSTRVFYYCGFSANFFSTHECQTRVTVSCREQNNIKLDLCIGELMQICIHGKTTHQSQSFDLEGGVTKSKASQPMIS